MKNGPPNNARDYNRAKLTWNFGSILAKAGMFRDALPKLLQARETLCSLAPVDASLITIDLCEVYTRVAENLHVERQYAAAAAHMTKAYKEARSMLQFIEPLRERTPLAEVAARGLALVGTRAEGLTLPLLEASRQKLKAKPVRK